PAGADNALEMVGNVSAEVVEDARLRQPELRPHRLESPGRCAQKVDARDFGVRARSALVHALLAMADPPAWFALSSHSATQKCRRQCIARNQRQALSLCNTGAT